MKKAGKILGWTFLILILLLAMGITFTIGWRPFVGPRARPLTGVKFQSTPARLARGDYLVNDVTACMECHAPHQWPAHDAPILPNMVAAGQDMTVLKGLPGRIIAPNISPDPQTGAGNWTDDQLARAIREGIGHDGRALFPIMPYQDFRAMSDEDLASIIVYLRSLPPVHQQQPTQFSPDGRWVAYSSNETGNWEVYVSPFPSGSSKWQVSRGGGEEPRWRRDGKELFYLSGEGKMMAVEVRIGSNFETGPPVTLFQTRTRQAISFMDAFSYDVTRDGQKFLIDTRVDESNAAPLSVILNWVSEIEK